ncbi:FAD-dependent oxidoreductase [Methylonatrum kenyense]|uniref:FAD-dependent oxidoreductase n=1 Tax=Methylonatrum kenyense TaxID=455253 RepID=UPI0020BFFC8F|nr:FAD-dependent oxidoreductase [Methylonatrum kenyense]MCK8516880.1 FAD-dependent oxidoreductase [Methylonatrum kenyense]
MTPGGTDQLVLLGGGHSHLEVLHRLRRQPAGQPCMLVSDNRFSLYSGMLPGYLAGHYRRDQIRIDLARLARSSGVNVIWRRAIALDRRRRRLLLDDGTELGYGLLSINTGASPAVATIPGAARYAIAVKPLHGFIGRIQALLTQASAPGQGPLTIVGGGAGGVELALALHYRFRPWPKPPAIRLISGRRGLLPGHNHRVRALARKHLQQAGITTIDGQHVTRIGPQYLQLDNASEIPSALTLLVTAVRGPDWLRNTDLALDSHGFIRTHANLRSISDEAIFAAGDIASIEQHPLSKAGVYAVRQGPVLSANLRAAATGGKLRCFQPRQTVLGLITTGPRHAIVSYGGWAAEGRWAWHWKNMLDQGFIARYRRHGH